MSTDSKRRIGLGKDDDERYVMSDEWIEEKFGTVTRIGTPEQMLLTEKIRNFIAASKVDPDLIYHKFVSTVDKSDKTFVLVRVD